MAVDKLRLRHLEPRLHQVMEVTVPHDMARLQSQRCAIEQCQRDGNWELLRKEQRNATLTIKVDDYSDTLPHKQCIPHATGPKDTRAVAWRLERASQRWRHGSVWEEGWTNTQENIDCCWGVPSTGHLNSPIGFVQWAFWLILECPSQADNTGEDDAAMDGYMMVDMETVKTGKENSSACMEMEQVWWLPSVDIMWFPP